MTKQKENAKQKILKSAIKIFANKGFDGARVDEIAKEASVPKSLIYYHFKSKELILDEAYNIFFSLYEDLLEKYGRDLIHNPSNSNLINISDVLESEYPKFIKQNEDLARVMLIESLKKSNTKPEIFRIAEILRKYDEKHGLAHPDKQFDMIIEFFTNSIPKLLFKCLEDSWSTYFEVPKQEMNQNFVKAMNETHGEYHRKNKT